MDIKRQENSLNFKGRVFFFFFSAREHAKNYRKLIHNLKHGTVNNSIDHFISLDLSKREKFVCFSILTQYKTMKHTHEPDFHTLRFTYLGTNIKKGERYLLSKLEKIREWKKRIDLTPNHTYIAPCHVLKSQNKENKFLKTINNIKHILLNLWR